jgi:Spy/CpxP family protein refolding chaperone
MRMNQTKALFLSALAVVVVLTLSPALRAQDSSGSATAQRPSMPHHGGMMGGDMSGMMNMMQQMSRMMDHCSRMMQGMDRPESKGIDPTPK